MSDVSERYAAIASGFTTRLEGIPAEQWSAPTPCSEWMARDLVGRLLCADTLIHTWDLARATGQPEDLDPTAVGKAMEFLTPIDDAIRGPGRFAAKIQPSPDAGDQTRLLNFSGRAV